mgnify:CR=1 FL=1
MTAPITGRWFAPPSIFPAWVEALVEENHELRKALAEAERQRDELVERLRKMEAT